MSESRGGETPYDHIVVGAGSAGAVIAARLTQDPDVTVLLLEAGPADRNLFIRMPAGIETLLNNRWCNWNYMTEPQAALDGRRLWTPRGKVLGGSSSINGMVYIRGNALDYDRWSQRGAVGWSYEDVLPYFRRLENHADRHDDYHGDSGPVRVVTGKCENPLTQAFIEAGLQAGYPYTPDVNGHRQEGIGRYDMNVDRGRRASSAFAYLRPAMARRNLTVATGALAERIVFERGVARGVAYLRNGRRETAYAAREIVLSAGAINTPQLLLASGVGPADALRRLGAAVVADVPQVGSNLQDHVEVLVGYRCLKPISLYRETRPWRKALIGAQWLANRTGPAATNHYEAGGFIRSMAGIEYPDIQLHFIPMGVNDPVRRTAVEHGFKVHVGTMRSESRGTVTLRSLDLREPPAIDPNYMSTEDDWRGMRASIRLAREILTQPALKDFRGAEVLPGPGVETQAEIDGFIRARANTAYHPSGTCRMGSDDGSVVDPQCRVRGVGGLRVADASIMPGIVTGNLNVPTMMIGEKVSDLIAGKSLPPAAPAMPFIAADWRQAQR